jgi:hypothetical protein
MLVWFWCEDMKRRIGLGLLGVGRKIILQFIFKIWDEGRLASGRIHWLKLKTKLRDFSLRANYTDRATAACRRS